MPLSKDPAARAKQLANLHSTAAASHGAYSAGAIPVLRKRYATELAEAYPSATEPEIAIQAHRLAQLELLGAFMDERGVIRHKRRGEVFPAAALMERVAAAFERQHAALLDRERTNGKPSPSSLESHIAQIGAGGSDDD